MTTAKKPIETAYEAAKQRYADIGVDTDRVIEQLSEVAISLHCWQGDDVAGLEGATELSGGIAATGNHPGKARNGDELRADFDAAIDLIPGSHRLNLHAMYAETEGVKVDRNELEPEHFSRWMDWATGRKIGLDFNGTFFSHPKADDGFTLSHADDGIRRFWIEHGIASRRIAAAMGRRLGTPAVCNVWIPDGYKDLPIDRLAPRERLSRALDDVFAESLDSAHVRDAVESKLFGIGSESYVVGSHDFYMGYAMSRRKWLCVDMGHFHPTELVADKLSALMMYVEGILLHVSRGVRWDSDHVVILSDELRLLAEELVRHNMLDRVAVGLDFFDASINRVAAYVIGARAMGKALLMAMLQPLDKLQAMESAGDLTGRLAWLEDLKTMPAGAVWDAYCVRCGVPPAMQWLDNVRDYEKKILAERA